MFSKHRKVSGKMALADLDRRNYDVVMLCADSVKINLYVRDKLKAKFHSNRDTVIEVADKKGLAEVRKLSGVFPPFSDRWLAIVDMRKFTAKEICELVSQASTFVFLLEFSRYKSYKDFLSAARGKVSVVEEYLMYLRRADILYLYDALAGKDKLSKPLFDFVAQGYANDVDAVLELFMRLNAGERVASRSDVIRICGMGGLTVEGYVFSLLKPSVGKKAFKNRVQAGRELGEAYGYPSLYWRLVRCVSAFGEIKALRIGGIVHKRLSGLPKGYDERSLVRYGKYIDRLNEIGLSEILGVYEFLRGTPWRDEADFLTFVYQLYCDKIKKFDRLT